ncbi:MAG: hypothetical protein KatS3mg051_1534 [Anaerolineae bacterium]|nr:MAG: hypothetical protein KatS3mg051_1534 [Anaerolineae bacterium]
MNSIAHVMKKISRLRAERARLAPGSSEWQALANELFEARCDLGHARAAARPERYRCTECGEIYNAAWVRMYGLVCDAECDGQLRKLEPTPRLCPECGGDGYVEVAGLDFYSESHGYWLPDERQVRCPKCGGSGEEE